jgi:hypothetical protein
MIYLRRFRCEKAMGKQRMHHRCKGMCFSIFTYIAHISWNNTTEKYYLNVCETETNTFINFLNICLKNNSIIFNFIQNDVITIILSLKCIK